MMKYLYPLLLVLCCASFAHGQKVEYAVQLNTGLTKYTGNAVTGFTSLVSFPSPYTKDNFSFYPHGTYFTPSYGLSVQAQRVTSRNLLFGLQLAAESLRSKTHVVEVLQYKSPQNWSGTSQLADGKTVLIYQSLNLQPYLGYRFKAESLDLDLSLGSDFGYCLTLKEKAEVTAQDGSVHVSDKVRNDSDINFDIRPRAGITAYRNQIGLSVSYAYGLTNYMRWYEGYNLEAYTRVVRVGLIYKL